MGYPTQPSGQPGRSVKATGERAEALLGERGRQDDGRKALTRADAAALGAIAVTATHVSAAPTAAEHNALVDDMKAIAALLNKMGANFTGL